MAVGEIKTREGRLAAAGAVGAAGAAAALALRRLRQVRSDDERRGGERAFRLRTDERLAFGLRRVARGRLESALDNLRDEQLDEADAVHEARKDLKKLRSVLRLARPSIEKAVYDAENARYGDAARMLSGVRDAHVRAETVGALIERFESEGPPGGWDAVADALAAPERIVGLDAVRREAAAAIEPGREVLRTLGVPGTEAGILAAGMRRTYRRGRSRLADAQADPSVENLHDLRKRAKDLWYHLRLVRDACAPALDPLTERSDRLSDLLGDDHDLAILGESLDGELEPAAREHLQRLIGVRRLELRFELLDCAETIYHERPQAFAQRIAGLFYAAA